MSKYVIIGGLGRSGTNLARRIIGSHSEIAIPPSEFKLFRRRDGGKSVEDILKQDKLSRWNVDFSPFYHYDYQAAYVQAIQAYAKRAGKEIAGEKTPFNEFYYDTLRTWFAGDVLKFVHMVRNPFDVLASHKNRPRRKTQAETQELINYCRSWYRSTSIGLARAYLYPNDYYLLKYEDLTNNPVDKARDLCAFLEIEPEVERMINMVDYKGRSENTSFSNLVPTNGSTESKIRPAVGRKDHLAETEKELVIEICGELACAIGYEDDDFKILPPDFGINMSFLMKLKKRIQSYTKTKLF